MRVLIVKGYLITAADTDEESIPQILGCAKGCIRITELRDGAVMYTDREAVQRKESPYNAYASLPICSVQVCQRRPCISITCSSIRCLQWRSKRI